jgi:hypothetical protein
MDSACRLATTSWRSRAATAVDVGSRILAIPSAGELVQS